MKGSRFAVLCLGWLVVFGAVTSVCAQWNPLNPVVSFEKKGNALEVRQKDGLLRIEVDAPEVLHVTYAPLDAGVAGAGVGSRDCEAGLGRRVWCEFG